MRKGNEKKVFAGSLIIALVLIAICFITIFVVKSNVISNIAGLNKGEKMLASTKIGTNGSVNPDNPQNGGNRLGYVYTHYTDTLGEIAIDGGNSTGWNYRNGYCLRKGELLIGGSTQLYNNGNAYNSVSPQVKWLLDNMVVVFSNNYNNDFYRQIEVYKQNIKTKFGVDISGLDKYQIFEVQQCAIWHFTNGMNDSFANATQQAYYSVLINNAQNNYSSDGVSNIRITKSANSDEITQSGDNLVVGPFTIVNDKNLPYIFNYSNFTINGVTKNAGSGVKIFQSDRTTELNNNSNVNYSGDIYVVVYDYKMDTPNTEYVLEGEINPISYTTEAIYWYNQGNQPVTTILRRTVPNKITVKSKYFVEKTIDISLKKSISKINGIDVTSQNNNVTRHFDDSINSGVYSQTISSIQQIGVDVTNLVNKTDTNATYWMNKTPVEVEIGDEIEYSIKLFNEGEMKAKASKVTDYIPAGLKLSENSPVKYIHNGNTTVLESQQIPINGYRYDEINNVLIIGVKGGNSEEDYITEFDGNSLSYDEIIVNCKVVDGAKGILTNVAEISEYQTQYEIIEKDIDSTPDNWQPEGNENKLINTKDSETWRNYSNGKSENANDGGWHPDFLAQDNGLNNNHGDDDDFDKLIVKKDYKLTLKKINQLTSQVIDDIQFEVKRESSFNQNQIEDLGIVSTENGISEFSGLLSNNSNGNIRYTFTEIENNNYVQLKDNLKINLRIENGNIKSYDFSYLNRKFLDVQDTERTYNLFVQGVELQIKVNVDYNTNDFIVEIGNKPVISSEYGIGIKKISSGNEHGLSNVEFEVTRKLNNGQPETFDLQPTNSNGYTNILTNTIDLNNVQQLDYYEFVEKTTLPGYTKLTSPIKVYVHKTTIDEQFTLEKFEVECENQTMIIDKGTSSNSMVITQNGVNYTIQAIVENENNNNVLRLIVTNAPSIPIPINIIKIDQQTTAQIKGVDLEVSRVIENNNKTVLPEMEDNLGTMIYYDRVDAETQTATYEIKELNAPQGYDNIFDGKIIKVQVIITNGVPTNVITNVYDGDIIDNELSAQVSAEIQTETIVITIPNPQTEKTVDLALKKVIVNIDGKDVDSSMGKYDRLTNGNDKVRINTQPLRNGKTNAEYYLNKTPILVQKGSNIKYQIRIYNEGSEIDTTASKIKDYIPSGLKFENVYYRDEQTPLQLNQDYELENNTLIIKILNNKDFISKYDEQNDVLSYDYVTVECSVLDNAKGILTNIAEITEYKTKDENNDIEIIEVDRDSRSANWRNPVDGNSDNNGNIEYTKNQKWINYYGYRGNVFEEGVFKNYVGQQDDDDFEKVLVGDIDLVLKKVITNVGGVSVDNLDEKYQRFQNGKINVDTSKMNSDSKITTSEYLMNKTPIKAKVGDEITYQIRIYNEGSINAVASQIKDYIPKGLTFTSANYNGNPLVEGPDYTINHGTNILTISALKGHLIDSYDGIEPKYEYVTVVCTVNGDVRGLLTNIAEITEYETSIGVTTKDRDSETIENGEWKSPQGSDKNTLIGKSGEKWARYGGESQNGEFADYPGQQDDDDFEKIIVSSAYRIKLIKNCNNTGNRLSGVKFMVNGQELITGNDGTTDVLGPYELEITDGIGKLDMYTIKEVETKQGYSKLGITNSLIGTPELSDEFYVFISQLLQPDGSVKLSGGYINFLTQNVETGLPFDGINKQTTFYTTDENGNIIPVKINIKDDEENIGNYLIEITLGNNIEDSEYELFIRKIDENGNNVNGTKFKISSDNMFRTFENEFTTNDGTINLGSYKISNANVNIKDNFIIEEIETPYDLHILENRIHLIVTKNLTENGYEATGIKLITDGSESQDGISVILPNVNLKNGAGTVDIIAELENGQITITVPNKKKTFDLALRKHIIGVNEDLVNRWSDPRVDVSKLISGESTTAKYNNAKDPVDVHVGDIVKYNIRVYNEGEMDGFADIIMDDVPEGLEMICPGDGQDNTSKINSEYRWRMYRKLKDGEPVDFNDVITYKNGTYVETEDSSEAEIIRTDYLSKIVGESVMKFDSQINPNLLRSFDKQTMTEPDSRGVAVEFRVKSVKPNELIYNYAQISEDSDQQGNPVDDRDSTPNVWEQTPRDDDQDYDVIKVGSFDLALYKWVSSAIVTDDGKTTEYPSNHTQNDKTNIVNVNIPKDKLDKVNVKFKYQIKVENEGTVPGYAKQIKDHIPAGLKFDVEDNKEFGWVLQDDGTITTDYLKNTLLNPKDTAELTVVLTWVNGESNFGKKMNYAEISEDENEFGWPDIDSTPNNFKDTPKEDDEDGDVVMLQIRTGMENIIYVVISLVAVIIITGGVIGIKMFVLNRE